MKYTPSGHAPIKVARVYLRVSTDEQDLTRQSEIEQSARAAGYYIAGVYREKASGARADRPELLRMIADLQPGEVVVAEEIDRISRLPLPKPNNSSPRSDPKARSSPCRDWSIFPTSPPQQRAWRGSFSKQSRNCS